MVMLCRIGVPRRVPILMIEQGIPQDSCIPHSQGEALPPRAIALKGVSKNEVSEVQLIPASLEPFVLNPKFGVRVLA